MITLPGGEGGLRGRIPGGGATSPPWGEDSAIAFSEWDTFGQKKGGGPFHKAHGAIPRRDPILVHGARPEAGPSLSRCCLNPQIPRGLA